VVRWLRQHLDRRSLRILVGLVLVAAFLDFLFFTGFYGSDDLAYIEGSRTIASDGSLSPEFGATRLGVVLPGALVWWITGGSLTALLWSQIGYHLALVPIAYVLARLLLDERAGLVAAALVALNPLFYGYAGAVLPDNSATCCVGLSMIALVATRRYADPGVRLTSWSKGRFLGYLLAGAMVGFCYWCKETAVILPIPAAIFIMTAGPSLRSFVWIQNGAIYTLGIVLVIALELVVLRVLTGEWINRMTYLSEVAEDLREHMAGEGTTPFARLRYASTQLRNWMPVSMWLLLAGTAGYGLTRVRNVGIMMFFWFPALYMTIGTTTLSEYLPPPIQSRYYAIVVLPAAVMTAVAVSHLVARWQHRRPRARTRLVLVSALALLGVFECRAALPQSGNLYRAKDVRAFVAALERTEELYPGTPVVVAPYYAGRMRPLLQARVDLTLDGTGTRPTPPYVYIRKAAKGDSPDPDPLLPTTQWIDKTVLVWPLPSRWRKIMGTVTALVGASSREPSAGDNHWWAEVLLVRTRPESLRPGPN